MRTVIVMVVLADSAFCAYSQDSQPWPTAQWQEASPESQGFAADLAGKLETYVAEKLPHTTSALVTRNGFLVYERYYEGSSETQREVYSVTKSVVSCLIGMLLDTRVLESVDERLESLIPSLYTADSETFSRAITVRHLLTMTAGFDPSMTEGIGKVDIANLFQIPFASRPGRTFYYSNVAFNILSMIVTEKTGLLASEYAARNLFSTMGITKYGWRVYQGYAMGGDSLRLGSRDLAKVGYLMLRKGKWEGRQLLSEEWVMEASRVQQATPILFERSRGDYGYGWWVGAIAGRPAFWAWGFLDQFICVVPSMDLVVVLTGNDEKAGSRLDLVRDVILPSIASK